MQLPFVGMRNQTTSPEISAMTDYRVECFSQVGEIFKKKKLFRPRHTAEVAIFHINLFLSLKLKVNL